MKLSQFSLPLVVLATASLLSACGGSDGAPAPTATTLSGTAAVGVPIVDGTVSVSCASGSTLVTTTSSTGTWSVTINGQTLPCAAQVSAGTINGVANTTPYHSIATAFGTLNITPLTDLIVANLAGKDPATWFATPTLATLKAADVEASLSKIRTAFGLDTALGNKNPLTTAFSAQTTDPLDNVLEAIAKARVAAGYGNHADFFPVVTSVSITMPSGFNFAAEYAKFTAGTGTGTGTGTATGGTANLTVSVNANGIVASNTTIANVPKPGNQTEFCGAIQNDSTFQSIGASGGGTLTINSCSFSGNVGNISATLVMTSPISLTLPYTVTYTYN